MNFVLKNVKFKWTNECNTAFEELKKSLVSYPILRIPNPKRKSKLFADASGTHAGAILIEIDENGIEYMIGCASRSFSKAELNYSITEKEGLALIFGMKKFRKNKSVF